MDNDEKMGAADNDSRKIVGRVVSFNRGVGFLEFDLGADDGGREDGGKEVCLFRPNRLVVNGTKVPAGKFKTPEGVAQYIAFGDEIHAFVTASSELKTYLVKDKNGADLTVVPRWHCTQVWRGDPPGAAGCNLARGASDLAMETTDTTSTSAGVGGEHVIENISGRILINQLGTGTGRGNAGQTLISFTNSEGETDIAMFRQPRLFFINSKRIEHKEYSRWDRDHQMDVMFNAVYTPGIKEVSVTQCDGKVQVFQPNWRAQLVWIGDKPSDTEVAELKYSKPSKKSSTFLDIIQGCDYMTTRVEKIVDSSLGIITSRNIHIMFHIENLSIDGQRFTTSDNLRSLLQVGETLFAYAKPMTLSTTIDSFHVTHEAVQVWKGRKGSSTTQNPAIVALKPKENKSFIPLPSEATHKGVAGSIVGLEAPNLAYVVIDSPNPCIRGQKVLIVKHRFFADGVKLRYRGSVEDYLVIGDQIHCDIVEANPEQSMGKYEWIAVLGWKGVTVNRDECNAEISRKSENLRGRILRFKKDKGDGCVGGILQICLGPSKIGEKVVFTREVVYINGLNMRRADLGYVLRHNDKVQVEVKDVDTESEIYQWAKSTYDAEIAYSATNIIFGSVPSMKEIKTCDESSLADLNLCPTLAKRGLSLEFIISLYNGGVSPGGPGLASVGSSPQADPSTTESLPPTITSGRVIELKRPDTSSQFLVSPKVENAIVKIENGPYSQEKAFLHRSSLFCWGYNCAKADLMYLLNETDILQLDVQSSTNNKAVTCKVTCAWIGPHKSQKNKESSAMPGNAAFMKWLNDHELSVPLFHEVIRGDAPSKQFFPVCTDACTAKLATLLHNNNGEADAGILKMFQSVNGKESRKTTEVLFSRESFYIWNVPIGEGDLAYLINDTDKYFVEVTDLVGKEKRRWQTRMATENIPKLIATLVYIGGGRPKASRLNDSVESNTNLQQWLRKRGMNLNTFSELTAGRLPPKNNRRDSDEDMYSVSYPVHPNRKENSPFNGGGGMRIGNREPMYNMKNMNSNMNGMTANSIMGMNQFNSGGNAHCHAATGNNGNGNNHQIMDRQAAFLTRAMNLTARAMQLRTPEDPEVGHLLQDESDAELAIFLSKTLTNSILMYRGTQGGHHTMNPGNAGHSAPAPGPIGPPARSMHHRRMGDFNEFYADGSNLAPYMGSNSGGVRGNNGGGSASAAKGLYGLSTPLLDCQRNGSGSSNDIEPPHKRRVNEW